MKKPRAYKPRTVEPPLKERVYYTREEAAGDLKICPELFDRDIRPFVNAFCIGPRHIRFDIEEVRRFVRTLRLNIPE